MNVLAYLSWNQLNWIQLSWGPISWNPPRVMFTIPFVNISIYWYSFFFALGFFIGYYIFFFILRRFLFNSPSIKEEDILDLKLFHHSLQKKKAHYLVNFFKKENKSIYKKDDESIAVEKLNFFIDNADSPIAKVKGCINAVKAKNRKYLDHLFKSSIITIKKMALFVTDKVTIYIVISTLIGSRLGEILFYQDISYYLKNPLQIFNLREGGLASHGAGIGIIIALILLSIRLKKKNLNLSFVRLLDFISIPTLFAGGFIRIGNFFNQEILGKPTSLFWGVIFENPLNGAAIVPRHPVQLYEALFYFILFFIMLTLSYIPKLYLKEGKLIGIFLTFVFSFRFWVEFLKEKQSLYIEDSSFLTMGQYLSLPFILLGLFFLFRKKENHFYFT